eukprot:scaffold14470_cov31-Phaeocystis_antarctica.AAC.2
MSAWVHPGLQPVAAVSEADGAAIAGARAVPLQRATAPRAPGTLLLALCARAAALAACAAGWLVTTPGSAWAVGAAAFPLGNKPGKVPRPWAWRA